MAIQEEREINGLSVTSRMIPPMRAYKLLARLGKLAGPISRALTPTSIARIKGGDFASAVPIAMAIFTELTPDDAESLAIEVLCGTGVNVAEEGKPAKLLLIDSTARVNAAFSGNLKAMLGAMMLALEVNYKDFFADRGKGNPDEPTPTPSL